jgi:hypothetical protein
MKRVPLRLLALGVFMAASLSACVVYPARPVGGVVYDDEVAVAPVAPPAPYAETYGVAPAPGYFWIGGVWFWEGGRHVWHPGHWEAPRPGYHWVPHTWVRSGNAWHLRGGRWAR